MLKLFIGEQGSERMLRFAEGEEDCNMVVSALARVEARSAISRLRTASRITPAEFALVLDKLFAQVKRMTEQPVNPQVLEAAGSLIDRYSLRALDAVQLGSALIARERITATDMRLIASDDKALLDAARRENFEVWDPMNDSLSH